MQSTPLELKIAIKCLQTSTPNCFMFPFVWADVMCIWTASVFTMETACSCSAALKGTSFSIITLQLCAYSGHHPPGPGLSELLCYDFLFKKNSDALCCTETLLCISVVPYAD